jgi:DNA-binding response OmpR family regulator
MGLIQVGTLLASAYFEEGNPMTNSHLPASKRTIMVVDDNPDIVTHVKILLEIEGYRVQSAYRGKEVFNLLEEQKPDLILLDVMMPKMGGMEVLRRLKGAPETSSIPVIMLTVLDGHEDIVRASNMGAEYYITKPFTKEQLLDGINQFLSTHPGDSVESP